MGELKQINKYIVSDNIWCWDCRAMCYHSGWPTFRMLTCWVCGTIRQRRAEEQTGVPQLVR